MHVQDLRELHCVLGSILCKALATSLHCYCYHNKKTNNESPKQASSCQMLKLEDGKKLLTSLGLR